MDGDRATGVDVQLGASAGPEAIAAARGLCRLRERGELPTSWEPVYRVCEEWQGDGPIGQGVAEVWCELDLLPAAEDVNLATLAPSVFILLRRGTEAQRMAAAARALELLVDGGSLPRLQAALDRCAAACRDGSWISHVGVMLGRSLQAMRVHVSGVPLRALRAFLDDVGWTGDAGRAQAAARLLLDHGDALVVCLDVVSELLPRIGLECFFDQKQGLDPRWRPLLDRLIGAGLGTAEKAEALLSWPGVATPADSGLRWPDPLVLADLAMPESELGLVERRLSHVKITLGPDGLPQAKAYFGTGRVICDLLGGEPANGAPPHRHAGASNGAPPHRHAGGSNGTPPHRRAATSPAQAVERALAFLLARRNQAGWWRDFFDRARPPEVDRRITGYSSDEWVTAYVGALLARLDEPSALIAAQEALELLLDRREHGGWGYHALLPADADTTTWVLRLAASLNRRHHARLDEARAFVLSQVDDSGGVCTYPADAAQMLAAFLAMPGSYDGWCGIHVCVTAAAAALDLGPATVAFLRGSQRPDGSWAGHWWDDDEYTTARAVEVLAATGACDQVARAVRWAGQRIGQDGAVRSEAHGGPSPFATALALCALKAGGAPREGPRARAGAWLVSEQRSDGSWAPSARLRVPAPEQCDPLARPDTTLTYLDDDAVFTTATVLAALAQE